MTPCPCNEIYDYDCDYAVARCGVVPRLGCLLFVIHGLTPLMGEEQAHRQCVYRPGGALTSPPSGMRTDVMLLVLSSVSSHQNSAVSRKVASQHTEGVKFLPLWFSEDCMQNRVNGHLQFNKLNNH